MERIRIKRTNQKDLVFTGKQIATVNDQKKTEDTVVGLQLTLYQSTVNAYILAITLEDNRQTESKVLHGAVSFVTIDDVRDFLLSEEGQGIADLLLLLLEQAAKTRFFVSEGRQTIIPNFAARGNTGMRQTIQ
ncbi:MAG: hypothetical protein ACLFTF_06610 [Desulfonatronovibrio sp.]